MTFETKADRIKNRKATCWRYLLKHCILRKVDKDIQYQLLAATILANTSHDSPLRSKKGFDINTYSASTLVQ